MKKSNIIQKKQVKFTLKAWSEKLKQEEFILKRNPSYIEQLSDYYNLEYKNIQKKEIPQKMKDTISNFLKKRVIKNLKEGFKAGLFYKGALEHQYLLQDPSLKSLRSKAARKRGHTFEVIVKENIEKYLGKTNQQGYVFKVPCGRFGNQPFDLILFLKNQNTYLLECKAGGVIVKNSNEKTLEHCTRRYSCYSKMIPKIGSLRATHTPYFFIFRTKSKLQSAPLLTIVPEPLINRNLNRIYTKDVVLDHTNSITIYESAQFWPDELIEKLEALFKRSKLETDL